MSHSQEVATESTSGPPETIDQELRQMLEAVDSGDGEGIAAAIIHLANQLGPAAKALINDALAAPGLKEKMLAIMTGRAKTTPTAATWTQLASAAGIVESDELAVEAADAALKIEPVNSEASLILAVAANRIGQYDKAQRAIADLVGQAPAQKDQPYFIIQKAIAEMGLNQPTAALTGVDAALPILTAAGLGFDGLVLRARALGAIPERGNDAVTAWERAFSSAQHQAQTDYARGGLIGALRSVKKFDEGLRQLDEAIANSTNAEERSAWSEARLSLLVEKGDIDGALAALDARRAAATAPEERQTLFMRQARVAAAAGRWQDAAVRFDSALTELPKDADDANEQRREIILEKVRTLVPHDVDLVMSDLDKLDELWPADEWPVPIDIRVNALSTSGKAAEALAWLTARVARTPALENHPAVHEVRAETEMKLGNTEAATAECRLAIDLAPVAADARGLKAVMMCAFGSLQWKVAVDAYDRLNQLDKALASEPSLRIIAGVAYLRLNDLGTALKLTEDTPPVPLAMLAIRDVCRGEAQLRSSQYDEALATTEEALKRYEAAQTDATPIQVPPEFLLTLYTLRAQAFNQKKKFEDARQAAGAAIDIADQPGAPLPGLTSLVRLGAYMQRSLALYQLGNITAAQRDIDDAIKGFEQLRNSAIMKMVEQAPEFANFEGALWYAKGAVLDSESRSEEALAAYTRAEKLEKQGSAAAIARGYALSSTGAFTEATFVFDVALTRAASPLERANAFSGKGRALVRLGKYEKAINALQSALDARLTSPDDDPVIFEQLGIAYSALQRNLAARRAFERAWNLTTPEKRRANLARGVTAAELRLGDPEATLNFLNNKVPSDLAGDRALLFNRALALDALGRRREAIPFLVRAKDAGLDRAQLELDRLDAPAGLGRWTHYWFGAQASRTRRAFGTALAIIAALALGAPLFQWWLTGQPEWYLLLLPSVVALLLLALPNMKSIGFEGAGLSVSVEPLSATGRDAAEVGAPESFPVPTLGAVPVNPQ